MFTNLDFPILLVWVIETHISDHLMIVDSFDFKVLHAQHCVLSTSRGFRDFDIAESLSSCFNRLDLNSSQAITEEEIAVTQSVRRKTGKGTVPG